MKPLTYVACALVLADRGLDGLHQQALRLAIARTMNLADLDTGDLSALNADLGHHGNLLVYGPGRYRFGDFAKVGTPLTVLSAIVVAVLAPLIWRG